MAVISDGLDGLLQIDGVPQGDGGGYKIEAAGSVLLGLETAVAYFAQPVEEDGPGEGIAGLPLVESGLYTAAQLDILEPVEGE